MIGIGIITHGKLASGLHDATHMIMGENENFDFLELKPGEDTAEFADSTLSLIESVHDGEGVLVFVDMFGATPFNTVASIREQLNEKGITVQIISGVNLPMVVEALALRQGSSLNNLVSSITTTGKESIQAIALPSDS
jgi:PTS system mannose-specific IIA component